MSNKSAVATDMNGRQSTPFHTFNDKVVVRDDEELYLGDGGDVELKYNSTRDGMTMLPEGQFVEVRGLNMAGDRYELVERFERAPKVNADILSATEATRMIANPNFELLGVNAVSGSSLLHVEGGVRLTTAGADGDGCIILPHLDANQSAWNVTTWGTDKSVRWECVIRTGSAAQIDNCIIWAGLKLTNTDVVATDADQVYFRYENGVTSGNWVAVSSIGGSDDAHDTGLAVAATTTYHLVIEIDSSRVARFYINGTLYETSAALTDTTDLIPYIAVEADGAGEAKILDVYKTAISRAPAA